MKAYTVAVDAAETSLVLPVRGIVSFSLHNQLNVRLRRLFRTILFNKGFIIKPKGFFSVGSTKQSPTRLRHLTCLSSQSKPRFP